MLSPVLAWKNTLRLPVTPLQANTPIHDFPSGHPRAALRRDRPILIVLHQAHSTPGRIGRWLIDNGYRLDVRKPRFGDPLPTTMDDHAGAIIFGGPMSANDPDNYIKREIDWIGVPLRDRAPFLGVCLGAQMMVRHLGGHVGPHSKGRVEIGYHRLSATAAGERLCRWPATVFQWHKEGFSLPGGTQALVETRHFPNQAFVYGTGFGIQFHPEITYHMVNKWSTSAAHMLARDGAQPRREQLNDHHMAAPAVGAWLDDVMPRWLAGRLQPQTRHAPVNPVAAATTALPLAARSVS